MDKDCAANLPWTPDAHQLDVSSRRLINEPRAAGARERTPLAGRRQLGKFWNRTGRRDGEPALRPCWRLSVKRGMAFQ